MLDIGKLWHNVDSIHNFGCGKFVATGWINGEYNRLPLMTMGNLSSRSDRNTQRRLNKTIEGHRLLSMVFNNDRIFAVEHKRWEAETRIKRLAEKVWKLLSSVFTIILSMVWLANAQNSYIESIAQPLTIIRIPIAIFQQ